MNKRAAVAVVAVASLVGGTALVASLSSSPISKLYTCVKSNGVAELGWTSTSRTCPAGDRVVSVSASDVTPVPPTTKPPVPTTLPVTTTTKPGCVGTPLVNGQPDIDSHPAGTAYCLTGVHNWTLTPKSGDTLTGGILDGGGTTRYAIGGYAPNVTIQNLEVRNYRPLNQQGAIFAGAASGWTMTNIQAHDNGTLGADAVAGGYGLIVGPNSRVNGGRFYNNRQGGIGGGGATGARIDGAELDHNNFTDNTYTTANIGCGYEAGGMKWTATTSFTVTNSYVHDNACRGLWADVSTSNNTITNNRVANNWADGIMVEISGPSIVTGNVVTGNGFKEFNPSACQWGYGAGILISTSIGPIDVSGNTVADNCQAITGIQQNRGAGSQLAHVHIHDNTVTASARAGALNWLGMATDVPGVNLAAQDNTVGPNTVGPGIRNCQFTC